MKVWELIKEYPVQAVTVILIVVLGIGIAFMAVTQTIAYEERIQRCESLGGVYVKGGQCIKGELIKL